MPRGRGPSYGRVMEQRIGLITLAVADLASTRRFYVDGVGWKALYDLDDVLMVQVGAHAGAALVAPAPRREWGGYSGCAAEPDGYHWEVASAGDGPLSAVVLPGRA